MSESRLKLKCFGGRVEARASRLNRDERTEVAATVLLAEVYAKSALLAGAELPEPAVA